MLVTSLRPRKPEETGLVERLDGRTRHELLNETLFFDLGVARAKIANWVIDYTLQRSHLSPKHLTPSAYATYSPQRTIDYATPTSSADRLVLYSRTWPANDLNPANWRHTPVLDSPKFGRAAKN
ncbi:hypothetical protein AOQ72_05350 [Bradyrhizobium yuanmingense]|uniref:Integrase catalytic domain-containing protein n=1 Tax=Bradyrhizobium yuanmingense TaxID=108015 RepID=A0A0R3BQ51_9BRAD|nr:integrase core domain-containing protein [Bradyrhizobium yuanmingense]KRP85019.1 hypothetical protein AOQ72_05350 [Bradyrhizobium yuanmingense]